MNKMLIEIHNDDLERGKKIGIAEGAETISKIIICSIEEVKNICGITPVKWEEDIGNIER